MRIVLVLYDRSTAGDAMVALAGAMVRHAHGRVIALYVTSMLRRAGLHVVPAEVDRPGEVGSDRQG